MFILFLAECEKMFVCFVCGREAKRSVVKVVITEIVSVVHDEGCAWQEKNPPARLMGDDENNISNAFKVTTAVKLAICFVERYS